MGTLNLGKSDFEAVENYRQDTHFKASLSIEQIPPRFWDLMHLKQPTISWQWGRLVCFKRL